MPSQRKPDVFIGVPHMGSVEPEWAVRLAQLYSYEMQRRLVSYAFTRGAPIDVSRNNLVIDCIRADAQWLFFLDSDSMIPADIIDRLLANRQPIMSGLYFRRHPPITPAVWLSAPKELWGTAGRYTPIMSFQRGSIIEAHVIGMGACLVNQRVFERMNPEATEYIRKHGDEKGFNITNCDAYVEKPWFKWSMMREKMGICALPGQNIFLGSTIESVLPNESIMGSDGLLNTVTNRFLRDWDGEIMKILPSHIRLPISVTPQHKILIMRAKRKSIFHYDNYLTTYVGRQWETSDEQWIPAGNAKEGDFVAFPIPETLPLPGDKPTSPEALELLGLYFAEGSCYDDRHFGFSLGTHEIELQEWLISTVKQTWNKETRRYIANHGGAYNYHVNGKALVTQLKYWFGTKARNKKIPPWILFLPSSHVKWFLRGVFRGDGFKTYNGLGKVPVLGINIATKEGALGLVAILAKLGIIATLRPYIQPPAAHGAGNPIYHIKIYADAPKLARILGFAFPLYSRKNDVECSFIKNGKVWHKIDKIDRVNYAGPVYDLAVSPTHSYVLEGMVVSNSEDFEYCEAARAVGFKILVDTNIVVPHGGQTRITIDSGKQPPNILKVGDIEVTFPEI